MSQISGPATLFHAKQNSNSVFQSMPNLQKGAKPKTVQTTPRQRSLSVHDRPGLPTTEKKSKESNEKSIQFFKISHKFDASFEIVAESSYNGPTTTTKHGKERSGFTVRKGQTIAIALRDLRGWAKGRVVRRHDTDIRAKKTNQTSERKCETLPARKKPHSYKWFPLSEVLPSTWEQYSLHDSKFMVLHRSIQGSFFDDNGLFVSLRRENSIKAKLKLGEELVNTRKKRQISRTQTFKSNMIQRSVSNETPSSSSSTEMRNAASAVDLREAIQLFNENLKEGMKKLREIKAFDDTPFGIAHFLFYTPMISKDQIGEIIGDGNSSEILENFVSFFDFNEMDFESALRRYLFSFTLPGEAQKIDRILQKFADKYYDCSKDNGVFKNATATYIFSFAVIMLNTDLHNPNVKRKMTKGQFLLQLKGVNGDCDFPEEMLRHTYNQILDDEIRIGFAQFPNSIKRGWLIKESRFITKKLYWILEPEVLHCFSKPGETVSLSKYHLEHYLLRSTDSTKQISLIPISGSVDKELTLIASDLYLFRSWSATLNRALYKIVHRK